MPKGVGQHTGSSVSLLREALSNASCTVPVYGADDPRSDSRSEYRWMLT